MLYQRLHEMCDAQPLLQAGDAKLGMLTEYARQNALYISSVERNLWSHNICVLVC